MSQIKLSPASTGAGVFTIASPATATDRTLTLPDSAGTLTTTEAVAASGYTTSAAVLTQFNASGSAPVYACRAWVNFNGTGAVAIRASGNVSSITDRGVGLYRVNFTTAMSDANYCVQATAQPNGYSGAYAGAGGPNSAGDSLNSSYAAIEVRAYDNNATDSNEIYVAIFR
jgi:hypothetical protein